MSSKALPPVEDPPLRPLRAIVLPAVLALALGGLAYGALLLRPAPVGTEDRSFRALGTLITVTVVAPASAVEDAQRALHEAEKEVCRLEGLLSRYDSGSEVSRLNRAAGGEPLVVSGELIRLLTLAKELHGLTRGALDVAVKPLLELWDFKAGVVPSDGQIEAVMPLLGADRIQIDPARRTAQLPSAGMAIDLGSIAKGYIAGRVLELLHKRGYSHALIDAGGDLAIRGQRGDRPWIIGLRNPLDVDALRGRFQVLRGGGIVTSGSYARFFTDGRGHRFSHIIDPRTGRPTEAMASATVLHPDPATADGLATALMVLSPAEGLALVSSIEDAEAILITPQGTLLRTNGVSRWLKGM